MIDTFTVILAILGLLVILATIIIPLALAGFIIKKYREKRNKPFSIRYLILCFFSVLISVIFLWAIYKTIIAGEIDNEFFKATARFSIFILPGCVLFLPNKKF